MTRQTVDDRQPRSWDDPLSFVARDLGGLAALVLVAATLLATGSTREALVALPFLLAAVLTPSTVAFAAGQLAVLPVLSVENVVAQAVAQVALLVVLTEPARTRDILYAAGVTLVATVGLVALLAASLRYGLVVTGGLLCLTVACGTYLTRRLTLVRLGLISDDESPDASTRVADRTDTSLTTDRSADRSLTEAKE
ncbi:hypothetical protein ABNG03_03350 [Halorubrum sp. RMP-47]|uniref:DUF8163 domain-containing protein n=1 Tax=Halorubrum miltondacostae TaxID=3076378 RepID=A0ABD5M511_9EURY